MGNKLDKEILEFEGKEDRYNGIVVDSNKEENNCDLREFKARLVVSIEKWKKGKKRGIWFKIHSENTEWIPVLIKSGFRFHHAQESYVMMTKWLPEQEPCSIPKYPHHYIGIGALVINENKREVLVVQERYGVAPHWKLPGGYVEAKENLAEASRREVFEETGISTEFVSMIAFRQVHDVQFHCSDIYFVCHLQPINTDIKKCDRELIDCRWMALEEYRNSSEVNDVNRQFIRGYFNCRDIGIKISSESISLNNRQHIVYSVTENSSTDQNS